MDKFDALLAQLKGCTEFESRHDFLEVLPESIAEEHFKSEENYKIVAEGLDVDKHRWYETSITVIEIYGRLLGVRLVTDLFSESMSYSDVGWEPAFFEMVQVQVVSYVPKE